MKKEFENLFSLEPLNMRVYEEIITVLNIDGDEIGTNLRIIADKEGFGVVMDCLVAILLDKGKEEYWDRVFDAIRGSFLIYDFLKAHPNKDKLAAITWYCLEVSPYVGTLAFSVGNRLKDPRDCEEYLDPYQYESYSRTHPDVVKEINKLKKIFG